MKAKENVTFTLILPFNITDFNVSCTKLIGIVPNLLLGIPKTGVAAQNWFVGVPKCPQNKGALYKIGPQVSPKQGHPIQN